MSFPFDGNIHPKQISLRSYNTALLTWAVCGMAIGHFLLCNYLEVLVKPQFEEPVNSVQVIYLQSYKMYFKKGKILVSRMYMKEALSLTYLLVT